MKIIKCINKIIAKNKNRNNDDINYDQAKKILSSEENAFLIDVRSPQEYKENHLSNSTNISLYEIDNKIEKIIPDKDCIIILYCTSGTRSRKALEKLKKIDYKNLYNLKGGIEGI